MSSWKTLALRSRSKKDHTRRRPRTRRLFAQQLEDRRLLAAVLYVDAPADYVITNDQGATGLDNGDEVTWNPSGNDHVDGTVTGLIYGTDAFGTIAAAVSAANSDPGTDTVNVAAGTYDENVVINKNNLALRGAKAGISAGPDANPAGRGSDEAVIQGVTPVGSAVVTLNSGVTGSTLDGFTIRARTSGAEGGQSGIYLRGSGNAVQNNIIDGTTFGPTSTSLVVGGVRSQQFNDMLIQNNSIQGFRYGMNLDGGPGDAQSTINSNYVTGSTTSSIFIQGSVSNGHIITENLVEGNNSGIIVAQGEHLIADNTIRDNSGVAIWAFANGTRTHDILIEGNILENNGWGIIFGGGGAATTPVTGGHIVRSNSIVGTVRNPVRNDHADWVIDASGNWFGSTDPEAVLAAMTLPPVPDPNPEDNRSNDQIDFTPFLDSGADIGGAPGFQGDFSTLHVTALGEQTGGVGRIQEGINLVTASTVIVEAGSYTEDVNVNKTVDLIGANAGISAGPNGGGRGAESTVDGGFRIFANGVIIDGFEILNGVGPAGIGDITAVFFAANTSGHTIANNIITGDDEGRGILSTFNGNNDDILIEHNEISHWIAGIHNQGNANVEVTCNFIHDNVAGVANDFVDDVRIQKNDFKANDEAVGTFDSTGLKVNNNDLDGNDLGVANYGGDEVDVVDAAFNWWGTTDPVEIEHDLVEGDVNFTPWLVDSVFSGNALFFSGGGATLTVNAETGDYVFVDSGGDVYAGTGARIQEGKLKIHDQSSNGKIDVMGSADGGITVSLKGGGKPRTFDLDFDEDSVGAIC